MTDALFDLGRQARDQGLGFAGLALVTTRDLTAAPDHRKERRKLDLDRADRQRGQEAVEHLDIAEAGLGIGHEDDQFIFA